MGSSPVPSMLSACEGRYSELVDDGIAPDVARDRIWDCYEAVMEEPGRQCADPRDRLFRSKLETIRERGTR